MVQSGTNIICIFSLLSVVHGHTDDKTVQKRFFEAKLIAESTIDHFLQLFSACARSEIENQGFQMDHIQKYLFYPAKTTVGYNRKFSTNRRFFANLIGTTQFHHMLEKDEAKMQESFMMKLKFCDTIALSKNVVSDMYDRDLNEELKDDIFHVVK